MEVGKCFFFNMLAITMLWGDNTSELWGGGGVQLVVKICFPLVAKDWSKCWLENCFKLKAKIVFRTFSEAIPKMLAVGKQWDYNVAFKDICCNFPPQVCWWTPPQQTADAEINDVRKRNLQVSDGRLWIKLQDKQWSNFSLLTAIIQFLLSWYKQGSSLK